LRLKYENDTKYLIYIKIYDYSNFQSRNFSLALRKLVLGISAIDLLYLKKIEKFDIL